MRADEHLVNALRKIRPRWRCESCGKRYNTYSIFLSSNASLMILEHIRGGRWLCEQCLDKESSNDAEISSAALVCWSHVLASDLDKKNPKLYKNLLKDLKKIEMESEKRYAKEHKCAACKYLKNTRVKDCRNLWTGISFTFPDTISLCDKHRKNWRRHCRRLNL